LDRNPLSGRGDMRGGKTPYDLFAINLKITQGTANVEDMRIEAPPVRLALAGSASIPARELDLRGVASLMSNPGRDAVAFELPFVVQGPWADPVIWPDAQALINRPGAAAPLLDAVRNRLQRNSVPPRPAETQPVTAPAATPAARPASSAN